MSTRARAAGIAAASSAGAVTVAALIAGAPGWLALGAGVLVGVPVLVIPLAGLARAARAGSAAATAMVVTGVLTGRWVTGSRLTAMPGPAWCSPLAGWPRWQRAAVRLVVTVAAGCALAWPVPTGAALVTLTAGTAGAAIVTRRRAARAALPAAGGPIRVPAHVGTPGPAPALTGRPGGTR